ncbi:hypothetical protein FOZ62_028894 [Perkinsus olseni]|uniref:Man1/Src1 C-terminal domain-containing protein n=1 Tax=Perkinsus olseni TaxID=32597 RepID=A0A7J6S519_PEROL|nr:hypothetical protein FOZ62_028894 [Perkinsus olseni]
MSTYASMTIAELRSLLTRNGVKVPQSSVKKAVLVNEWKCSESEGNETAKLLWSYVSEGAGARGLATGVLNRQSAATDATKFERKQSSRGSAATRRGSRRRSSLASATNSEGTDLVDVARVFSSDDEELSEMSESPITSRYERGRRRTSVDDLPKPSPSSAGGSSVARRRRSSRPPSRSSALSSASVDKTLFASPEDDGAKSRRVTISPLSYLRPLKEAQTRRRFSKVNTVLGIFLLVAAMAAYWYLPGPRLRYCDGLSSSAVDCEPCRANAVCQGYTMKCNPLFKRDGDVCVRDEHLYMVSHHMAASLADHLADRRGDHECYKTRYQLDAAEAKRYLRERCWEARRLGKADFETAFNLMLSESLPNEYGSQVVYTTGGTLWSLKSSKRLSCRITEAVEMWWKAVFLVGVLILFTAWRFKRWSDRRWARRSALQAVTACTRLGSDGSIRGVRVHDLATEVLGWPEERVRAYMDQLSKEEADVQSSGDGEYWSDAAVKKLIPNQQEGQRDYTRYATRKGYVNTTLDAFAVSSSNHTFGVIWVVPIAILVEVARTGQDPAQRLSDGFHALN